MIMAQLPGSIRSYCVRPAEIAYNQSMTYSSIKRATACITLILGVMAFSEDLTAFKTEFQDVPPKYIVANGTSSGISYEIMKLVGEKSGYRFEYEEKLVPLARVSRNLGIGLTDIQFGLQKTRERERTMTFGPALYGIEYVGVMRANDPDSFDTLSDLVRGKAKVLTPSGTGASAALRTVPGLILDDGAQSAEAELAMLRSGRGKILVYHNLTLNYLLSLPENAGLFKKIKIDFEGRSGFVNIAQYVVYSRDFPDEARERINRIIAEAIESGELAGITDKYLQ